MMMGGEDNSGGGNDELRKDRRIELVELVESVEVEPAMCARMREVDNVGRKM
jgi:hypothetical protein